MTKSRNKILAFVASGDALDGNPIHFSVYEFDGSFEVVRTNPIYRHLCHPTVKSYEDVKNEILLVFGAHITNVKYPFELNARTTGDNDEADA